MPPAPSSAAHLTALKAMPRPAEWWVSTAVGWIIENHKTKERGVPEFCDHVDHIKKLIGVDHVSVATDSPLRGWDRLSPHRTTPELSDIGHWKAVAAELHRRGYSEDDLKKIFGLNLVILFRQVLKP